MQPCSVQFFGLLGGDSALTFVLSGVDETKATANQI